LLKKVKQVKTRNEELMTRQQEFFSRNAKTYESESSMENKDGSGFEEVGWPWGASLYVPEEVTSS
jgi:hypothetical protein